MDKCTLLTQHILTATLRPVALILLFHKYEIYITFQIQSHIFMGNGGNSWTIPQHGMQKRENCYGEKRKKGQEKKKEKNRKLSSFVRWLTMPGINY